MLPGLWVAAAVTASLRRAAGADWARAKALYATTADDEDAWRVVLKDQPDVLYSVIAYIVKVVKATTEGPPKTGRRPKVSGLGFDQVWDVLYPQRYTMDPLPVALPALMRGRSQRQVAALVPCDQATLSRVISGRIRPDVTLLRSLALALDVPPTYFPEYRAMRMAELVADVLLAKPDVSATVFKRLRSLAPVAASS